MITVKRYLLRGTIPGPVDKYCEPTYPLDETVFKVYSAVEEHLKRYAVQIKPREIVPFPMEGVISGPKAESTSSYLRCMVENEYGPARRGVYHLISIAGVDEDIGVVETVLNMVIEGTFPAAQYELRKEEYSADSVTAFTSISELEERLKGL